MPILNTTTTPASDCDVVSSSCSAPFSASDDEDTPTITGTCWSRDHDEVDDATSSSQRTFITQIADHDDEFEGEKTRQPKKRGPKKKRMTPARIAKLKQRRIKVSNQHQFTVLNIFY